MDQDNRTGPENSAPSTGYAEALSALPTRNHSIWFFALFYLGAVAAGEIISLLFSMQVGLAIHGLTLIILLLQSALSDRRATRRFLMALSLAPLIRLLSMIMPLRPFPMISWYVLVGTPLGIAAVMVARYMRLNRSQLGLTVKKLPVQLLIGLTGIGLGYIEFLILRPQPLISKPGLSTFWLPALVLLIFTGLLEEFIFRGVIQFTACERLGRGGIPYTAAVFAVLHTGYHSALDVLFVFLVALFFGWTVRRSGSILGPTLAHGITNICLFLVFPFFGGL